MSKDMTDLQLLHDQSTGNECSPTNVVRAGAIPVSRGAIAYRLAGAPPALFTVPAGQDICWAASDAINLGHTALVLTPGIAAEISEPKAHDMVAGSELVPPVGLGRPHVATFGP